MRHALQDGSPHTRRPRRRSGPSRGLPRIGAGPVRAAALNGNAHTSTRTKGHRLMLVETVLTETYDSAEGSLHIHVCGVLVQRVCMSVAVRRSTISVDICLPRRFLAGNRAARQATMSRRLCEASAAVHTVHHRCSATTAAAANAEVRSCHRGHDGGVEPPAEARQAYLRLVSCPVRHTRAPIFLYIAEPMGLRRGSRRNSHVCIQHRVASPHPFQTPSESDCILVNSSRNQSVGLS